MMNPFYKNLNNNTIIKSISELKNKKNAIILAHYYQYSEIQDFADFVGDSYGLAIEAKRSKADVIVFAGVKFMAETAKIVNPTSKVLLPDLEAGCSLADSCPPELFKEFLKKYPNHTVITYVNSSVEIKAMSDITCTSSNAEAIIKSLPEDEKIIFAPDKNLGHYLMQKTGRKMVLWDGTCHVHNQLHIERVLEMQYLHPEAILLAHPECQGVILDIADFVGSTSQIIEFSERTEQKKFIIATETGILHQLQKKSPEKEFFIIPADESCGCNDCNFMKMITPEKILHSLEHDVFEITIEESLRLQAEKPINRMIDITNNIIK
jgi:quinolinate synthase